MKWMLSFGYTHEVERISFLSPQSLSCCCYGDFYDGYFWRGCIECMWERTCLSVCVLFHAVISCVSLRAGDSAQHPEQQEREKKSKSKKEGKKGLLASKLNLRCLDEILVPSVNIRKCNLLPFVLPQRMTQALTLAVNRWWTPANDGQILQCSEKRHSENTVEEKCWCWVLWSKHNSVKLQLDCLHWEAFFPAGLFRPQRFYPLKAACTDVEERLLLHDKISPSKFDLKLPGQSALTSSSFFFSIWLFRIFVGSDLVLC